MLLNRVVISPRELNSPIVGPHTNRYGDPGKSELDYCFRPLQSSSSCLWVVLWGFVGVGVGWNRVAFGCFVVQAMISLV